jgi:hypothetical protein
VDADGNFAGLLRGEGPLVTTRNLIIEVLVTPRGPQLPWATIVSTHPGTANFLGGHPKPAIEGHLKTGQR